MARLRSCAACGFLSTLNGEFTRIEGITFDLSCAEAYRDGYEPIAGWVRDALACEIEKHRAEIEKHQFMQMDDVTRPE